MVKYHPEKVILLGSAARCTDVINDVDLFIIKDDVPLLVPSASSADGHRFVGGLLGLPPCELAERLVLGDPFVLSVMKEGKVLHG